MSDVKNINLEVKSEAGQQLEYHLRANSLDIVVDPLLLVEAGFSPAEPLNIVPLKTISKSEKLAKKTGYYIVPLDGFFHYYKIPAPIKRNDHLYDFTPNKKTIREGFVVIDKELIYVTLEDLERRIIRTSRIVRTKKTSVTYADFVNNTFSVIPVVKPVSPIGSGSTGARAKVKDPLLDFSLEVFDGSKDEKLGGAVRGAELDEQQAIDLVIKEQERALLDSFSEEEGLAYEIA